MEHEALLRQPTTVQAWAVPAGIGPGWGSDTWWQLLVGVHHRGTYREGVLGHGQWVTEVVALDLLRRLRIDVAPDGATYTLSLTPEEPFLP